MKAKRRGAPPQLGEFHKWIAAHALSHGDKYESMVYEVRAAWGISKAAIDKALKGHGSEARALLAALGPDPADIKLNIEIMAEAFRTLALESTAAQISAFLGRSPTKPTN